MAFNLDAATTDYQGWRHSARHQTESAKFKAWLLERGIEAYDVRLHGLCQDLAHALQDTGLNITTPGEKAFQAIMERYHSPPARIRA